MIKKKQIISVFTIAFLTCMIAAFAMIAEPIKQAKADSTNYLTEYCDLSESEDFRYAKVSADTGKTLRSDLKVTGYRNLTGLYVYDNATDAAAAGVPDGYSGNVIKATTSGINRSLVVDYSAVKIPVTTIKAINFRVYFNSGANDQTTNAKGKPEIRIPVNGETGSWGLRYSVSQKVGQWVDVSFDGTTDSNTISTNFSSFIAAAGDKDGYFTGFELCFTNNGKDNPDVFIDSISIELNTLIPSVNYGASGKTDNGALGFTFNYESNANSNMHILVWMHKCSSAISDKTLGDLIQVKLSNLESTVALTDIGCGFGTWGGQIFFDGLGNFQDAGTLEYIIIKRGFMLYTYGVDSIDGSQVSNYYPLSVGGVYAIVTEDIYISWSGNSSENYGTFYRPVDSSSINFETEYYQGQEIALSSGNYVDGEAITGMPSAITLSADRAGFSVGSQTITYSINGGGSSTFDITVQASFLTGGRYDIALNGSGGDGFRFTWSAAYHVQKAVRFIGLCDSAVTGYTNGELVLIKFSDEDDEIPVSDLSELELRFFANNFIIDGLSTRLSNYDKIEYIRIKQGFVWYTADADYWGGATAASISDYYVCPEYVVASDLYFGIKSGNVYRYVDGISVNNAQSAYAPEQGIDLSALTVTGTYKDGAPISAFNPTASMLSATSSQSEVGEQTITVTYYNASASFDIVVRTIKSIRIDENAKTEYYPGQEIDVTAISLTQVYTDGSEVSGIHPSASMLSSARAGFTTGSQTISVTLGEFTETFDITVSASLFGGVTYNTTATSDTDFTIAVSTRGTTIYALSYIQNLQSAKEGYTNGQLVEVKFEDNDSPVALSDKSMSAIDLAFFGDGQIRLRYANNLGAVEYVIIRQGFVWYTADGNHYGGTDVSSSYTVVPSIVVTTDLYIGAYDNKIVKPVSGISANVPAEHNMKYAANGEFDVTGVTVTVDYLDPNESDADIAITSSMVSAIAWDGSNGSVTVNYMGKTCEINGLTLVTDAFAAVQLSLDGDIGMHIYVVSAQDSLETKSGIVGTACVYNGLPAFKFTVRVNPKDYNTAITFDFDDIDISASYAVADIISTYKSAYSEYTSLGTLVRSLESYCAAATAYFGGETVEEPSADVTISDDYRAEISGSDGDITVGTSLTLESNTSILIYFQADSIDGKTFSVNGTTVTPTVYNSDENIYLIKIQNVSAKGLNDAYTVVVGGYTVKYSALSYAYVAQNSGNDNLVNLVKHLYNYNVAADRYFDETKRGITIDGVDNARYVVDGKVYRSAELDNVTEDGIAYATTTLGIKTELDLRGLNGNGNVLESSALTGAEYINAQIAWYEGAIPEKGAANGEATNNLRDAIKVFADEDNYPIIFHCSAGRDRTGTLAILLEGVLGWSKEDILRDFELTLYATQHSAEQKELYLGYFNDTYNAILERFASDGEDFQTACENLMLQIGVTADEISSIRTLLAENV